MWKWEEMEILNICDIEGGVLDSEFELKPEGYLWQDQTIFFKVANEAIKYDFESEEGFTLGASPQFNTLSTEKWKEVVASAKKTFNWQSSKEGKLLKKDSFKDWMFSRPLALRPIYWKAMTLKPTSKWSMGRRWTKRCSRVRRCQISD